MPDPAVEAMLHEREGRGRDAAIAERVLGIHIARRREAINLEEMQLLRSESGLAPEKAIQLAARRLALFELEQSLRHDVILGQAAGAKLIPNDAKRPREKLPLPE